MYTESSSFELVCKYFIVIEHGHETITHDKLARIIGSATLEDIKSQSSHSPHAIVRPVPCIVAEKGPLVHISDSVRELTHLHC